MEYDTPFAVMAQRIEPAKSLDFFPTRAWATRALCNELQDEFGSLRPYEVWEPACGEGHMSRPLGEYFGEVYSSDVFDYGYGRVFDFLSDETDQIEPDWIITNPPFNLAADFIERSLRIANVGVAMLVRTSFLESATRYERIFKDTPPNLIYQFCERVPMHRGRIEEKGSTATAYCWLVWVHGATLTVNGRTQFRWIAPCRAKLEKPEDYA